ncbi:MAG: hypothetical protein LKH93_19875 [Clostridium beijerinckii]|jgi:hypothetical protein|nr:hypothetical protein [Clostridium beijerinckii]MCI1578949.1 hypothetical protein [Clostridium beijerinckii]MCI1585085.1 hypothetical protein [Clostridium beijerinckii]MCI1624434.1 hypothetical protein [Clostridium beijerinckii]
MSNIDVLSARLEVKDSFTNKLNSFVKSVLEAETAFNSLVTKMESSSLKLEQSLDRISRKMEESSNRIAGKNEKVANSIVKQTERVEQIQNKSIDNISKKYTQMGTNVQNIFKTINKDAETLAKSGIKLSLGGGNGNSNNKGKGHSHGGGSSVLGDGERAFGSLLSGNFEMMAMQMGIIGGAVLGVSKLLSTIDNSLQQGFNILNNLSTGLLSINGIYEGAKEAGKFEQNRVAMNILYGNNKELGHQYYKMGVTSAKITTYGEQDTGELQKKLAGAHISYNQEQLNLLADIASLRPEQPLSKVGFSIVDAMYGRTTSLKSQYMLDNKEVQTYLKNAMAGKIIDKETGQKVDGRKWKDAFNTTGTVKNKQEYFDLLMSFVINETNYKGLNQEMMKTALGKLERLQGNWETLKAQILGIDANDTGEVRKGSVIDSLERSLDNLSDWLEQPNVKELMGNFGDALGKAFSSIADAVQDLLKNVNWSEAGKTLKKMGDSIADFIKKLTASPEFTNFINNLPKLLDKVLKDQGLKWKTEAKTGVDLAQGNVGAYIKDWSTGQSDRAANIIGLPTSDEWNSVSNPYANNNANNNLTAGDFTTQYSGTNIITDYNASTYLAKNPNLSDEQREEIHDYMSKDKVGVYNNITIEHITADNFDEIMESLQSAQGNQK